MATPRPEISQTEYVDHLNTSENPYYYVVVDSPEDAYQAGDDSIVEKRFPDGSLPEKEDTVFIVRKVNRT